MLFPHLPGQGLLDFIREALPLLLLLILLLLRTSTSSTVSISSNLVLALRIQSATAPPMLTFAGRVEVSMDLHLAPQGFALQRSQSCA